MTADPSRLRAVETLPDSPDPVEIAMDLERFDPALDSPARRLLVDQGRLVRTQIASERTGVALKLLTAVAGLAAAAALAFMAWDASRTEALVLQPFSVPPELVERGVTGEVVATRLLDGLGALQAETVSSRAPGSYANDWGDDVQVQIPQTGVSIGELQDFLRGWLGQETSISGEVVRTAPGRYAVTARTGTEPGRTFEGAEAELNDLIRRASEAVYESTQPERYAAWLTRKDRKPEAAAILERLTISGERQRRAWAFAEWAALAETPALQLERAGRAIALDPELSLAHLTVAAARAALGHDEAALAARRRAVEVLEGRRARDMAPWSAVLQLKQSRATVATALGDHGGAAALYVSSAEPAPDQPPVACRQCSAGAYFAAATALANNHDAEGARRMTERGAALLPQYAELARGFNRLTSARARGDWPAVAAGLSEPAVQAYIKQAGPEFELRSIRPTLAVLEAETGQAGAARARVAGTPLDCYDCVVARGVVAARAGDRAASERWFARAAKQAPSLPQAHLAWAEARLVRGDVEGAIRLLREARERGPRWADPLKAEGDAHARAGDHSAAVKRYAEAAERAPRWGALHLAWGRSLQALGRREQAQARYAQAARLDLSAADRARVKALLAQSS